MFTIAGIAGGSNGVPGGANGGAPGASNPGANGNGGDAAGSGRRLRRARGGEATVASGALRTAGLMDDDVGMKDSSAIGSGRTSRKRSNAVASSSSPSRKPGSLSSRMKVDSELIPASRPTARQRLDPLSRSGRNRGGAAASTLRAGGSAGGARDLALGRSIRGSAAAAATARVGGGGGVALGAGNVPSPTAHKTVQILREFVNSRWNAEHKFLNLENMAADPILLRENIKPPGQKGANRDTANVIWKITRQSCPEIVTLSLQNNGLESLLPLGNLPFFLPNLQNLSLEGNQLKWDKDLDALSGKKGKFTNLRELILLGNPIHTIAEAAGNLQTYQSDIIRRFPTLQVLDRQPVVNPNPVVGGASSAHASSSGLPSGSPKEFPLGIATSFRDEAANAVVPTFLQKYFSLFDSDRSQLSAAYAVKATFSFSGNASIPPRAKSAGYVHSKDMPNQGKLHWNAYFDAGSRNVMKVVDMRARTSMLHTGPSDIIGVLKKLPGSAHPLTDPSKFILDAWAIPNSARANGGDPNAAVSDMLIFVSVHGEFAEQPSGGIRSFDRTFILAPAASGSAAQNAGWPCVILSDQLTPRHYSHPKAWVLEALNPPPAGTPAAAPTLFTSGSRGQSSQAHITPAPGITPSQHALALKVMQSTGLNYAFSLQCLQQNNWDEAVATRNFQMLKNQNAIPQEAFQTS